MKKFFFVGIALVLALVMATLVTGQEDSTGIEIGTVVKVVDGDTIDVMLGDGQDGEVYRVRYIGMNTPEQDQACYQEATDANADLVDGQTVYLRRDESEVDQFDRLLRYVYVGGTLINAQLVADGWAEAVEYPPDTAFADWFEYLESDAVAAGLGCHPSGVFEESEAQSDSADAAPSGVTITTTSNINLRGGPGTNYPVVGTIRAGESLPAEGRNGDWLYLGNGQWIAAWIVTVEGDLNSLPTQTAPAAPQQPTQQSAAQPANPQPVQVTATTAPAQPAQPAQPVEQVPQPTQPPAPAYTCDCGKTCGAMASCEEAYFQLSCGCGQRDGDGDGVPCEDICSGG